MLTIGSILVPVDLSAGSAEALRYAAALRRGGSALAPDASIEVVRGVDFGSSAA